MALPGIPSINSIVVKYAQNKLPFDENTCLDIILIYELKLLAINKSWQLILHVKRSARSITRWIKSVEPLVVTTIELPMQIAIK